MRQRILRPRRQRFRQPAPGPQPICSNCGAALEFHGLISGLCPGGAHSKPGAPHTFFTRHGARTMSADHQKLAMALGRLALAGSGSTAKFARDMGHRAMRAYPQPLTERQADFLRSIVLRLRRQLPEDIVALADSMTSTSTIQKGSAA